MSTGIFESILEAKQYLTKQKKAGTVFYNTDLDSLSLKDEFDFFFCLVKPPKSKTIAFPIKRNMYYGFQEEEKILYWFSLYYGQEKTLNSSLIRDLKIYKGTQWIWFYGSANWGDI